MERLDHSGACSVTAPWMPPESRPHAALITHICASLLPATHRNLAGCTCLHTIRQFSAISKAVMLYTRVYVGLKSVFVVDWQVGTLRYWWLSGIGGVDAWEVVAMPHHHQYRCISSRVVLWHLQCMRVYTFTTGVNIYGVCTNAHVNNVRLQIYRHVHPCICAPSSSPSVNKQGAANGYESSAKHIASRAARGVHVHGRWRS